MNKTILIGKSAAGKDHMRKVLESRGFIYGTSYTTRPARPGEIEGKDYFFMTKEEFLTRADANFWYEYVEFNGWFYGTSNEQFKKTCNLFIMTPEGVSEIKPEDRGDCTVIYLDIPLSIRESRLYKRGDINDKIQRRIAADEHDFAKFHDYDIVINNSNF
jgi:guanylate kinase